MIPLSVLQPSKHGGHENKVNLSSQQSSIIRRNFSDRRPKVTKRSTKSKPCSLRFPPKLRGHSRRSNQQLYRSHHQYPNLLMSNTYHRANQSQTRIQFSPTNLDNPLLHSSIKGDGGVDPLRTQEIKAAVDIEGPNRNFTSFRTTQLTIESHEESSGYSSSNIHMKSCHNLTQNSGDPDCIVWEQPNSC